MALGILEYINAVADEAYLEESARFKERLGETSDNTAKLPEAGEQLPPPQQQGQQSQRPQQQQHQSPKVAQSQPQNNEPKEPEVSTERIRKKARIATSQEKPVRTVFSAFRDDRRQPRGSTSRKSSTTTPVESEPAWYWRLERQNTRNSEFSSQDVCMSALKTFIRKCQSNPKADHMSDFNQIRVNLHTIAFVPVTAQLLRNLMMLHSTSGLPQLFKEEHSGGVNWPFDIKADAQELYSKWFRGVFDTNIMHGLIPGRAAYKGHSGTVDEKATTTRLMTNYKYRVEANYFGQGKLVNGQWWPIWLAALRDGAHGATMAGIHGDSQQGAYSCVLSTGKDYSDEDFGEWLWYCGTDGKDGVISELTKLLLLNEQTKEPVRVLRSSEARWKSQWAPEQGLRYDGLYHVVEHEKEDEGTLSLRQRHRFRLVRVDGQDPIRWQGPEVRPTKQELKAYNEDKEARGFT